MTQVEARKNLRKKKLEKTGVFTVINPQRVNCGAKPGLAAKAMHLRNPAGMRPKGRRGQQRRQTAEKPRTEQVSGQNISPTEIS